MVIIIEQTEDRRESSTDRRIHHGDQILLSFGGSRAAAEVVAGEGTWKNNSLESVKKNHVAVDYDSVRT